MITISIFSKKSKKNYLDFIPIKNKKYTTREDDNIVIIEIERTGFFDLIAQKLFKRPRKSYITLDSISSYVWINIDGQKNINDIALLVKDKFKDGADPLYARLVEHFKILSDNKFICYKKE